MTDREPGITAVVLAAGMSTRMGQPKMLLPWGEGQTIIGQVVSVLGAAGIGSIVVVTGCGREAVEHALAGQPVTTVYNSQYNNGEMLISIQTGLLAVADKSAPVLITLGDQPQIQVSTVQKVVEAAEHNHGRLVFPSYRMHRGHPWLVPAKFIAEILDLRLPQILRDFTNRHTADMVYVEIESGNILIDLDTPEDYQSALQSLKK